MKKKRIIYLILACVFFFGGILLHYTYRKYIYTNNIFDFHIADTLGNLVAMPAYVFFYYAIKENPKKLISVIGMGILTFILYEFLGLFGLHGTFDFYDIIATIISGIITYCILKKVNRFPQSNESNL